MKEVPFRTYAVKVFHDGNGNGRLDKSILGALSSFTDFPTTPAA